MNANSLVLGGMALLASSPSNAESSAIKRNLINPNIIFIYADDLGYGDLGCYGQKFIKTPNIDQLAKDGIRFTQIYTGAPVSAPARCCLMTGKNAMHSYVRDNFAIKSEDEYEIGQMPLPENTLTIPKMLKQAGYKTALIGKWGLGSISSTGAPNKQGFDFFYGYANQGHAHNHYPSFLWRNDKMEPLRNSVIVPAKFDGNDPNDHSQFKKYQGKDYALDLMTDEALKFINENKSDAFFLNFSIIVPHKALQVPDESLEMYKGVFDEQPYLGGQGYLPHPKPLSAYAAMITRLDEKVGIILNLLKELDLESKTIVIFASDNGPANGGGLNAQYFQSSGGLRGMKSQLYEGGIREPFIVRWPGKIKPGTESDHIGAQYDLFATLADIVKQKIIDTDGISFLPVLIGKNNKQQQHEYLYWEFPSGGGQIAIRIGDWKGIRRNLSKNPDSEWEVYNLKIDVQETNDLSEENPELIMKFNFIASQRPQSHYQPWNFMNVE